MISRRRFLRALAAAPLAVVGLARSAVGARRVELICRRAWGALEPTGSFDRHRIRRMTIHHSGIALRNNRDAPAHIRAHQRGHQALGWPDIAYHVVIDKRGNAYEGRPMWAVPDTSTEYDPTGHFTVMCEGNFEEQRPSAAQLATLVGVLAWAAERFDVAPRTIAGHRDVASTACPGDNLYRLISSREIRRRVKQRLASGGARLVEVCGAEGRRRIEEIESGG